MIANFEGTVGDAAASNEGLSSKIGGFISSMTGGGGTTAPSTPTAAATSQAASTGGGGTTQTISQEELIAEIKRLQQILVSGDAVVQVETAL